MSCAAVLLVRLAPPYTCFTRIGGGATTQRTAFFPLVLTENWTKGMRKIKCACLQPRGDGIYTIDPRWKGESDKGADKATIALMFEVMGEGLRQLPDGFEGERAWRLTLVRVGSRIILSVISRKQPFCVLNVLFTMYILNSDLK